MLQLKRDTYHLAGWLIYLVYGLIGVLLFPPADADRAFLWYYALLKLSYATSLVCCFYYCYAIILPGLFQRRQVVLYIAAAVLAPFIFVITRYLLEEVIYAAFTGLHNYGPFTTKSYYLADNLYRGVPAMLISAAVWALERAYKQQQENKQLREDKAVAELAFLRSQINPHFLYNTLNYIYSQAYNVSAPLADAVMKVSQLMRYMLRETSDGKVGLAEELEYLDSYIAIYKLRFANHFFVSYQKKVEGNSQRLVALLLIPFIENAFKHGVVSDPANPVYIKLDVNDKQLHFTVSNKINQNQKDDTGGIGLANTQRRLQLAYPGQHQLQITNEGGYYKAVLTLNFA